MQKITVTNTSSRIIGFMNVIQLKPGETVVSLEDWNKVKDNKITKAYLANGEVVVKLKEGQAEPVEPAKSDEAKPGKKAAEGKPKA